MGVWALLKLEKKRSKKSKVVFIRLSCCIKVKDTKEKAIFRNSKSPIKLGFPHDRIKFYSPKKGYL